MNKKSEDFIENLVELLRKNIESFMLPLVDLVSQEFGHDPYLILISCLLSLRAKDVVTIHVCRDLFKQIRTPQEMVSLPRQELEKIIYKTGFYKTKALVLYEVSRLLLEKYDGNVPDSLEKLLAIKGIGLKTANLVMGLGFGKPRICVDTHVNRISNRLGLIKTKTPEQTEQALMRALPERFWIEWNKLLVIWGQNVCVPISPHCSCCPIRKLCKRVGVTKSR